MKESVTVTQPEILQAAIAKERAGFLSHREKLTESKYFRDVCQKELNYLADAERFSQYPDPNWGIVQIALELAIGQRKAVEDAVSKYGYAVVAAPYDLH